MSKVLILANHYNTLRIFRRELLQKLSCEGIEVIVSIPKCDEENKSVIESYGCRVIFTPIQRRGMNPIKDIMLLLRYIKILIIEKPDKVLTYTIKPNIYGAIACKFKRIPYFVNITGLGSAFQVQGGLMRKLVSLLYKISINKAVKVFFENEGNRNILVNENIVEYNKTVVMAGAGVNLEEFHFCKYPEDTEHMKFLFVGRIMKEKGVDEYFSVIKKVKKRYRDIDFEFIGWYEESYQKTIEDLQKDHYITFYGFQSDVRPYIQKAHCIVLPSWHEGMSNTLLEAAAMGRPLITTDIYGCKEAVVDKVSGYLVHLKDDQDLHDKIIRFIQLTYDEKKSMGVEGRKHIEKFFDKKDVVNKTMKILFPEK